MSILTPEVAETERLQVIEGLTPIITDRQFRQLLASIDLGNIVGLRDRAIFGVLAYTIARGGAVGRLDLPHYADGGDQWMLRFREKGNKSREIPVSHDLKVWLDEYIDAAHLHALPPWKDPENGNVRSPLFPTAVWREKRLSNVPMTSNHIYRMMQRRLARAGLPTNLSPHSFRVAGITDLLGQKIELGDVQTLAGHADPRTTRLYDRSERKVTRNLVERIKIGR